MDDIRSAGAVVAGVDGSPASVAAVGWAAQQASLRRLPLRLVHAVWLGPPPYATMADFLQQMTDAARSDGRRLLAEAAKAATAQFPDLPVTPLLIEGAPVPTLVGESGRASMLSIGATGAGIVQGLLAGSTALNLLSRSLCPVIVIRGNNAAFIPQTRPVVLGVAGSQLDRPAVAFAFAQASFGRTRLVAVHAFSDTLLPPMDRLAGVRTGWPEVQQMEHRLLSAQLAGWSDRFPDVQVTSLVVYDRPAEALLNLALDAGLVVVGTRGRGLLAGALLGSVSRTLVQRSTCPVAVVPSGP